MKCPMDASTLVMSERSGIEIDYCPECRDVWLDRGELDKIIDRVEIMPSTRPEQASQPIPSQPSPLMRPPLPSPTLRRAPDANGYGRGMKRDDDRGGYDDRRFDNDRRHDDNRRGMTMLAAVTISVREGRRRKASWESSSTSEPSRNPVENS